MLAMEAAGVEAAGVEAAGVGIDTVGAVRRTDQLTHHLPAHYPPP